MLKMRSDLADAEVESKPKSQPAEGKSKRAWSPLFLGGLFVAAGLLINPWAMGRSASVADSDWDFSAVVGCLTAEAVLILVGLCLLYWRPRLRLSILSLLVVVPLTAATASGAYGTYGVLFPSEEEREIAKIGRSEKLYLALSSGPRAVLKRTLNKSVADLKIPDVNSQMVFAETVTVRDLKSIERLDPHETMPRFGFEKGDWPVEAESREVSAAELNLWRPLLDNVKYWKHAKFYIIHSEFVNDEETKYEAKVGFAGLALLNSTRMADIHGKIAVTWSRYDDADDMEPGNWRIERWETKELTIRQTDQLLFADVIKTALPNPEDCQRACTSVQEEYVGEYIRTGKKPQPAMSIVSQHRHPALSVVDIDRDGFDDLYVMARWGKNMLLRNRGDGTLEDVAADYGLDIENDCTGAIFADFDNDGDADLFLGRARSRSMYLVNEDGKFVDRSAERVSVPLPYFVSAISAADYNQDGLLDILFVTGGNELTRELNSARLSAKRFIGQHKKFLAKWLPEEQAEELFQRVMSPEFNLTTNLVGPPNMLLRNAGDGKFDVPPEAREVQLWRNTFQATWGDFDNDGDPDLYAANDFAPNNLLRNDGGKFVDVTEETRSADIGFGMGAAFGDYNGDGWLDLYVTNMYSKAGRRISAQLHDEEKKKKYATFAGGNTLLENAEGKQFKHVSGLEAPAMLVEAAGWGWGGQFVDVDNDGFEDIYTLSGFYTPPKEVTSAEDS